MLLISGVSEVAVCSNPALTLVQSDMGSNSHKLSCAAQHARRHLFMINVHLYICKAVGFVYLQHIQGMQEMEGAPQKILCHHTKKENNE